MRCAAVPARHSGLEHYETIAADIVASAAACPKRRTGLTMRREFAAIPALNT
jgi:hypothetical protein